MLASFAESVEDVGGISIKNAWYARTFPPPLPSIAYSFLYALDPPVTILL